MPWQWQWQCGGVALPPTATVALGIVNGQIDSEGVQWRVQWAVGLRHREHGRPACAWFGYGLTWPALLPSLPQVRELEGRERLERSRIEARLKLTASKRAADGQAPWRPRGGALGFFGGGGRSGVASLHAVMI